MKITICYYRFHIATKNALIASIILKSFYFLLCLLLCVGGVKVSTHQELSFYAHLKFVYYQECSVYLLPWLVADFIRQILYFVAFVFLSSRLSVIVKKKQMECIIMGCVIITIFQSKQSFGNLHDNFSWLHNNNPHESPHELRIREVVMQITP